VKRRYKLSKEAEKDIDSIKRYVVEKASVRVARCVLQELKEGMRFLGAMPEGGHFRKDPLSCDREW
jgi:plasmid stabilization system protein ParE